MIYKDKNATPEQRARDLTQRMTLEEKLAQMTQIAYSEHTPQQAKEWARRGAGSFLHVIGDNARELQRLAGETRLGIPVLFGIDAIHGHGLHAGATIFPSQLAAACCWDRELVRQMGRATAREVAADGLHWTFSPVLCLGRDTRWGRVNETFGEDPYLTGELGEAIIRGYQGDDLSADDSILACAKHYIGYGEALGGRDSCDTQMTFRKLRETFLPPFQKAVEAGCATIMTAYGSIDGEPFTASKTALHTILKEELGFDGFVVTDWDNVASLVSEQHVAETMEDASAMAAVAGNDMIMRTDAFYEAALAAVHAGKLPPTVIDQAVERILTVKFRKGLFDREPAAANNRVFSCPEHLAISEQIAQQSVVLLENRSKTLPLDKGVGSIAVLGTLADDLQSQYGDWTYFTHPKPNPEHPPVRPYATIWEGIEALAQSHGARACYHPGYTDEATMAEAVAVAQSCDCIVMVVGDTIDRIGERKDLATLELPAGQMELYHRLRALQKPLVVVLSTSKPLAITELADSCDALLCAFNGGMFAGKAVASVLFGKESPSGRLPISFPRHSGQLPVYYNQLGGWHGGKYADLPETPLYPFGYGLSYTTFEWSKATLTGRVMELTVKNTGEQATFATAQFYFRDCVSSVMTPQKQLIGFQRVLLQPGEQKTVGLEVTDAMLSLVNAAQQRVTEPGSFILMAGPSSRDEDLQCVTLAV